jgi:hypothetical protein
MKMCIADIPSFIQGLFKVKAPFHLPKPVDKVGFSDKIIKNCGLPEDRCYEVVSAHGDELSNFVRLHCRTVLYTGQWKILPKETPIKC